MNKNTWGIQFVKINKEENQFENLLALNIGDEKKTRDLFESFKVNFIENKDEPECVITFLMKRIVL